LQSPIGGASLSRSGRWPGACSERPPGAARARSPVTMAYRLKPTESVPHGLRRLALKELKSASEELRGGTPAGQEAIHEARTSIKKVRALLRLIEADDGRGLKRAGRRLQKVNRTLSNLRDADAMLETLGELRSRNPHLLSEHAFGRLRRRLSSHKRDVLEAADDAGSLKKVRRELRKLRRDAKRWRPAHRGAGVVSTGLRAIHRRGRKAMARALKRQRPADFHAWRKEMKTLWYQLRLVERYHPAIRRDVRALHRAQSWLGDDHNVVVLCEELSKDASICRDGLESDRLRLAADRYQCELRTKATARARRIYDEKSGVYARTVKRALEAAYRGAKATPTMGRGGAAA
jgi:CHAD domain-containing protein